MKNIFFAGNLLVAVASSSMAFAADSFTVVCTPGGLNGLGIATMKLEVSNEDPEATMTLTFQRSARPMVRNMDYEGTSTEFRMVGEGVSVFLKKERREWTANVTFPSVDTFSLLSCTDQEASPADRAEVLFQKFDNLCAGNSNGSVETFNPRRLNLAAETRKLRQENKGCMEGRVISTRTDQGAYMAVHHMRTDEYASECVRENFTREERRELFDIFEDPTNVAVLSSDGYTGDNSEACYFSHFWVYRANGKVLKFTTNETD